MSNKEYIKDKNAGDCYNAKDMYRAFKKENPDMIISLAPRKKHKAHAKAPVEGIEESVSSNLLFLHTLFNIIFNYINNGAITKLTIAITLIKIFIDGPDVSFKGSPTVSPTTAAL